jgi:hypothetical protein
VSLFCSTIQPEMANVFVNSNPDGCKKGHSRGAGSHI